MRCPHCHHRLNTVTQTEFERLFALCARCGRLWRAGDQAMLRGILVDLWPEGRGLAATPTDVEVC